MNALPPPSAADVLVALGPDATQPPAAAEVVPAEAFAAVLARLQTGAESIVPRADGEAGERPARSDDATPADEPDTASALDQVLLMTGMLPAQPPAAPVAVVSRSGEADAAPAIAEGNALPALARADRAVSDPAVDAAPDLPLPVDGDRRTAVASGSAQAVPPGALANPAAATPVASVTVPTAALSDPDAALLLDRATAPMPSPVAAAIAHAIEGDAPPPAAAAPTLPAATAAFLRTSGPLDAAATPEVAGAPALHAAHALAPAAAPQPVAAPPVVVAVATPAFEAGWHEETASKLAGIVLRGHEQAQIRLSPADLGPVEVRIDMRAGEATVAIVAPQAATRDALEQALPMLRDLLAQQGLSLGEASVRDGRDGRHAQDAPRQRFGPRDEAPDDTPAPQARRAHAARIVDTFA